MKKQLLSLLLVFFSVNFISAGINDLLPKPHKVSSLKCPDFQLNQAVKLEHPTLQETDPAIDKQLTLLITKNGGTVDANATHKIVVNLVNTVDGAEFQNEAYEMTVCQNEIIINAKTLQGAYWATQTLWQLSENNNSTVSACKITDWSAFSIRGYMHDIGRSYMQFDELKNEIVRLSRFKINVFHWHLTDNQGWRLESKVYSQLNANSSYTRSPGKYYTIEQAKELVAFAKQHGVTVIPEIDMPGHSEAFRKAMGHVMLTNQGLNEMKAITTEACETFADCDWIHIGSDEVRNPDTQGSTMSVEHFISQMTSHIHSKGKKIVVWNPGHGYSTNDIDMTQMWSSRGRPTNGIPTIDSRYHYVNHFDQYADVVSLYNSTIAGQEKGSQQYAGTIIGIWNDRLLPSDKDILQQNAFYQSMLAIAERAWLGGGKGYFTEIGTTLEDTDVDFMDWERRFLFHKAHFLQNEPIAYVKQTNIRWKITDQFPNNGNVNKVFPPETELRDSYVYYGKTYNTTSALGAGIYLRHTWGTLIPTFYSNPKPNHTAYAFTYVYSPDDKKVGLQFETQNYGRSEPDLAPPQGKWDYNNSKIWINDKAINPPTWQNTHSSKNQEITLKNENYSGRDVIEVDLKQGWNKVLIKLPNHGFSLSAVRLVKWMFTCAFTTLDGKSEAADLIYSPDKNMNSALDALLSAISKSNSFLDNADISEQPGAYSEENVKKIREEITKAVEISENNSLTDDDYKRARQDLLLAMKEFKKKVNLPLASSENVKYWYKLTSVRGNRSVSYKGTNNILKGENFQANQDRFLWKLVKLSDGTYSVVNRGSGDYITSTKPKLKAVSGTQNSEGWTFTPLYKNRLFIITFGTSQFNQGNGGTQYAINNWGNGGNKTDTGCQYIIELVKKEDNTAVEIVKNNGALFWTENKFLKSNISLDKVEVFNTLGEKIPTTEKLPLGVVLVKTSKMETVKLLVK